MQKFGMFCLFLLLGLNADAAQITCAALSDAKKARLKEIIEFEGCPRVTDKDIDLFLKDGQGLSVKEFILRDEQSKKKNVRIDFTSRSFGDKIIDNSLYLMPLGLTCIVSDIIHAQVEESSSKVISLLMCAVISTACHKYIFSRIESLSSLDRKISKTFPKETSLVVDRQDSFRSFIYFILNGVHSLGSIFFGSFLWSPNVLVKTFAGILLAIRTKSVLQYYSSFEEEDLCHMPIVTLGELVSSSKFVSQNQSAQ